MKLLKWLEFDRKKTPEYKETDQWYESLGPGDDDYLREESANILSVDFVYEYAKREHEEIKNYFDTLDSKAEQMFRFSIGITGASLVAIKLLSETKGVGVWEIASCLMFLLPVVLTVVARKPVSVSIGVTSRTVIEGREMYCADYNKKMIAASIRLASVGYLAVIRRKSAVLTWATFSLVVSIFNFAVTILVGLFSLSV